MEQGYNGWKNRQTWNVALWINNDEPLYRAAVEYVKARRAANKKATYRGFINSAWLVGERTPGAAPHCIVPSSAIAARVNPAATWC